MHPIEAAIEPARGPSQVAALERRLADLERLTMVEPFRFVGTSGQPSFANGWTNYDLRRVGFYRHAGRVHLTGVIRGGLINVPAFVLPTGYRPDTQTSPYGFVYVVDADSGEGRVHVTPNGEVIPLPYGTSNPVTHMFLSHVSFRHL